MAGGPAGVTVVRWAGDGVWVGTADGAVVRRAQDRRWLQMRRFPSAVEALLVDGPTTYVALAGGEILRSADGASSWTSLGAI